jgi:hypothetical protein
MTHWMIWLLGPLGILSTAVVFGTDMFFLTIARAALRRASEGAGTEVMGFFHLYADARMPIWGVLAIVSNFLLALMNGNGHRLLYFASVLMLILFVLFYTLLAKPINRIQIEAAQNGKSLINGRELQAAWDRLLLVRVPLLVVSLLAQCLMLVYASA